MTQNAKFKRRVRNRAAKTGESYSTALMHVRGNSLSDPPPQTKSVRVAVAQMTAHDDPRNITELRAGGLEIRRLMQQAHEAGAKLVHFSEGATCSPGKRIMSESGPDEIGPSDWKRCEWSVLREELEITRQLAQELGVWIVLGSVHELTHPQRPHNSLYVISNRGELVTRYDERMLSKTKISFMYTPGSMPITFKVDGIRFGCALGMECHFPEIFIEYERLNVDCVLFSTTGGSSNDAAFTAETMGHAASNTYWVSYAVHAKPGLTAPSGIVTPDGQWATRCAADGAPSFAIVDIHDNPSDLARPWRRTARSGIYDPHQADHDPRSGGRKTF